MCLSIAAPALAAGKANKITLNKTSVTLQYGATMTLTAKIYPTDASKSVVWTSSNKKVVTVSSSGKLTAKGVGTATVTVAAKNNSKVKATCTVTVKADPTSVSLNKTSYELVGKKYTLKATVYPAAASQKVTWKSSNTKVATVSSSGVVTPKGYGTATITATTSNGKTAKCTITVPKTKTYSKSYTIDSLEGIMYIKDHISVVVDGVTGKIISSDCYQTKRDAGFIGTVQKGGAKVIYSCDEYIKVRSNWTIKFGLWKLNIDIMNLNCEYIMYNDGTLKRTAFAE